MPTHHHARSVAAVLALAVLAAGLLGCRGAQRRDVAIEGPEPGPGRSLAVDVTNFNGSVRVHVEPRRDAPSVRARLVPPEGTRLASKRELRDAVWIGAEIVEQEGGLVLRVLTRPSEELQATEDVRVWLTIRVPDCDGALVRNAGGEVLLDGVHGAIQVDNGFAGADGGPIDVRAGSPIEAPIALTTTDGDVYLQVGPDARGAFEIVSDADGRGIVRARAGLLDGVNVGPDRWTGTLNGGSNPILLRTGSGDARLLVLENAASSKPRSPR